MTSALIAEQLTKVYPGGAGTQALGGVSLTINSGDSLAIMGPSGSGKTTLLNILAALDRPTAGEVYLDGKALSQVREGDLAAFRRAHLGFVFQDFNLLDTFSLRDNIYLPLVLAGRHHREMEAALTPIAQQLGIAQLLDKYPYEVSGGQRQRAAGARALITNPQLILADEPTGALDSLAADKLLGLFGELNAQGQTIVMVTHSVKAASHAGRVLFLRDGVVYHQLYRGEATQEQQFRRIADTLTVLAGGGGEDA
ncbi:MAG TPA: ABC transporter ATP-binding protein [Clostridiales bacterium]|nr:ABC transporter ATP-binding protein [Clostridiales bacterium]